jgi:hypothetical protein
LQAADLETARQTIRAERLARVEHRRKLRASRLVT